MTVGPTPRPPLDVPRLEEAFEKVPDLSLEVLPEAASTNAVAAERAMSGAPDGHVVVADHQTAGRGRLDRVWQTPPGTAVTFSMVLRPTMPASSWPWLPLLTGLTVAKTLRSWGYDAAVKWPNDVLIRVDDEARKVAGILVERVECAEGPAAVVGVGINVATTADELPVPTATSLAVAAPEVAPGAPSDRTDVLIGVVVAIREAYDAWQAGGEEARSRLVTSYAANCATVGQRVRVQLPGGGTLEGRAVDVDPDGRLVVEGPAGLERVGAGDVTHVRPADG